MRWPTRLQSLWQPDIELDGDDQDDDDGAPIDWRLVKLGRSEYERTTARLVKHQVDEDEPASNVLAVRFAPARVSWTTDSPVTPGLYFCKLLGGATRVVDVYADDRGRLQAEWSDIEEFSVDRPGMLWSNHSIQEPE